MLQEIKEKVQEIEERGEITWVSRDFILKSGDTSQGQKKTMLRPQIQIWKITYESITIML